MDTERGSQDGIPLVTDLDGTLIRTDSLWEGVLLMAGKNPLLVFLLPLWLLRGRLFFKARMLPYCLEASTLFPLNADVLRRLEEEKARGREIYLATAALEPIARVMAERLGIFSGVFASSEERNLKGTAKAERLVEAFGTKGFDYIGDSSADLPVWAACRTALLATDSARLLAGARQLNPDSLPLPGRTAGPRDYRRAVRLHQWMKNILVFVPLALAHLFTAKALLAALLAFVSFSLCASSVYVINDLLDLSADRRHHRKCRRPFAAGDIPVTRGPLLVLGLLAATALCCLVLPPRFVLILAVYYALTFSYSLYFKRKVMLDTVSLAGLYFLRIAAGAAAVGVALSNWTIAFSLFLFLGLGLMKRVAELKEHRAAAGEKVAGRPYTIEDRNILEIMSTCSAFSSMVVLALYIDSLQASLLYSSPLALWLALPLAVYWYGRILILTHRGQMDCDPVQFVIKDRATWCCAVLGVAIIFFAK
ncbi:UbiA prenyltransferase [Desulfovibrio sp. X2]|uniref:UbiA family prenyltransferase n=1 Tax=Desulfovibrio sp. X2 TaxID=941449 RepID=UPI000358BBDB|nr:UbiA family prenyltransferase [Desulfovibrio sp. X2]EPR37119.1 UbiA prenyltransferase [Desulfovibrio sp. X2]